MYTYDVALSFAGEDRPYVERVAAALKTMGVRVFYDKDEATTLWGKNLHTYLQEIYTSQARYTVMFISTHYKEKLWTNHERESAQARAFLEKAEYILPARFDDTQIPGMLQTVAYINLSDCSPEEFAKLIKQKLDSVVGQEASFQNHSAPTPAHGSFKTSSVLQDVPNEYNKRGVRFLKIQAYEQAKQEFEKSIEIFPEVSDSYYYLALASLKGRCPRELKESDIKKIENNLILATRLENYAHYFYFWAFVKYDFYKINGMYIHPPSYEELWARASSLRLEKDKIKEFMDHVPKGAERKNPLLKQLLEI